MTLIYFESRCWKCHRDFINPEYVNVIKLDDGSIHYVHGGNCSDGSLIHRNLYGDWWIRRMGTMAPYMEVDPAYLKALNEELETSSIVSSKSTSKQEAE